MNPKDNSFGEDFLPFSNESNSFARKTIKPRKSLIDSHNVHLSTPVKIGIKPIDLEDEDKESIIPLIENGSVVGVVHTCTCGKTTEIRFEFQE